MSRSAEQRWPAERKDDVIAVVGDLFGQRGGVDDHRVDAAGLGDQRHDRPRFGGERAVDLAADFSRTGEDNTRHAGMSDQARTDCTVPGDKMERRRRQARLMQKRNCQRRNKGRLLGGLGYDRIAGNERSGDLSKENRERKIPRADADVDTAAAIAQDVAFAGRSRHIACGASAERACAA